MKKFIWMVVFMSFFSFLTGCSNLNSGNSKTKIKETVIPEGAHLTEFYISQQGMAMQPRYMLKETPDGIYMKISNLEATDWQMTEDEENINYDDHFMFVDEVKDCEHASSVKLSDDSAVKELEKVIVESGSISWDGYDVHKSMKGVLDSGDSYELYMKFSNGKTVNVDGYNSHPEKWDVLMQGAVEIFNRNSDYSKYMTSDFFESECEYLMIEFYDSSINCPHKLELTDYDSYNRWSIVINDENKNVFDENPQISEYGDVDSKLPYDRFLKIIDKYCEEEWNELEDNDGTYNNRIYISMYFSDGKTYRVSGNQLPLDYAALRDEFVKEMYAYYKEVAAN